MSFSDSTLDEAIVAYVGMGVVKIPRADPAAVRALDPGRGAELQHQVEQCMRVSDTIRFDEVAPFDAGLRERLYARLRELLPKLGPRAIEARGWRWGFLQSG